MFSEYLKVTIAIELLGRVEQVQERVSVMPDLRIVHDNIANIINGITNFKRFLYCKNKALFST